MSFNHEEYMAKKKQEIMASLTPKLNAWGVTDFDYEYTLTEDKKYTDSEWLRIGKDYIGCHSNSVSAVEEEALGWLFIRIWCKSRHLGAFKIQTKNVIQAYWRDTFKGWKK